MLDRRDAIAALRRANPVPDISRVHPVPDDLDPLWQTIVVRSEAMDEQRDGAQSALKSKDEIDRDASLIRGRRGPRWRGRPILAGVGVAALVVAVLVGYGLVRSASQPDATDVVGDGDASGQEAPDEELGPFELSAADATQAIAAAEELVGHFNASRIDEALELIALDAVMFETMPQDREPAVGRRMIPAYVTFVLGLDGRFELSDCEAEQAAVGVVPGKSVESTARVICNLTLSDLLAERAGSEPLSEKWRFYVDLQAGTLSRMEGLPPNIEHLTSFVGWANANEPERYERDCAKVVWPNVQQIAEFDPETCAGFFREFAADWAATLESD